MEGFDFKVPEREDMPRWFDLSYDRKEKKLLFKIHKDYLKFITDNEHFMIPQRIKERKWKEFRRDFKDTFGFDGCMKVEGKDGDFTVVSQGIPRIKVMTNKPCEDCHGKGVYGKNHVFAGDKCHYCNGEKKKSEIRWAEPIKLACTVEVLSHYLRMGNGNEYATSSKQKQLLVFSTFYQDGMHGGSIGGEITPCMANWLKTKGEEYHFKEAEYQIKHAEHIMWLTDINDEFRMHYIDCFVRGTNRLCIGVPGDRSGIHPTDWYDQNNGLGYRFDCHNVDTPAQQLQLLIGLACVCDEARKEI